MNPRYIVPTLTFLILLFTSPVVQSSPARSITQLIELIKEDKLNASAYFRRGVAYVEKSDHDNAIKQFTKAITLKRDYIDAYYFRGTAYYSRGAKGDADLAISDLTKVIRLDPNQPSLIPCVGPLTMQKVIIRTPS